jgi:hypothetical protein
MMGEYTCRIERLTNGYEVEIKDPAIVKANSKPKKSNEPSTYRDPWKSFAFTTVEEVLAFLKKNLDKALPDDEYSTSFDLAAAEATAEDSD